MPSVSSPSCDTCHRMWVFFSHIHLEKTMCRDKSQRHCMSKTFDKKLNKQRQTHVASTSKCCPAMKDTCSFRTALLARQCVITANVLDDQISPKRLHLVSRNWRRVQTVKLWIQRAHLLMQVRPVARINLSKFRLELSFGCSSTCWCSASRQAIPSVLTNRVRGFDF